MNFTRLMLMFEYFGEALSAYLKITFILEDSLRLKKQDSEKKSLTEKVPQTSHSNKFMQFFTSLKLLYFWTKISSRRPFYFRMTLVFFVASRKVDTVLASGLKCSRLSIRIKSGVTVIAPPPFR